VHAYCAIKLGPVASARQVICLPQATWFRQSTAFHSLAMECHSDGNQQSADVGTRDVVSNPRGYVVLWGASGDPSGKTASVSEIEVERIRKSCAGRAVSGKSDRLNA
jgi:hypothetical protein